MDNMKKQKRKIQYIYSFIFVVMMIINSYTMHGSEVDTVSATEVSIEEKVLTPTQEILQKVKENLIDESYTTTVVTKGMVLERKSKFTTKGWVDIQVLKMDVENESLSIELLAAKDEFGRRETLSEFVKQANEREEEAKILAAINGSFFGMSSMVTQPIGIIYDEKIASLKHNYNVKSTGAFSLIEEKTGKVFIDSFGTNLEIVNEAGEKLYLGGINLPNELNVPLVFNEKFGKDTAYIDDRSSMYKVVVEENVVTKIAKPKEVVAIPKGENSYVFTCKEEFAKVDLPKFPIGMKVYIHIDGESVLDTWEKAISGGGRILENSEITTDGMIIDGKNRHPRSAIGVTADGKTLIAMVVDGRGISIGATHNEVAAYLLEYGVSDAMHLDGGGSSTLMARDYGKQEVSIVSTPSSSYQRQIINGIGFGSTRVVGDLARIEVVLSAESTFIDNPIGLKVLGFDSNDNPISISSEEIVWSLQGLKGEFTNNNQTFIPKIPGEAVLTCYYNGFSKKVEFSVSDNVIDITVSPKVLRLNNEETKSYAITGTDSKGKSVRIDPSLMTYKITDETIGSFQNGVFYSGKKTGISKVTIMYQDRTTSAYVVVGEEEEVLESFETVPYESIVYPKETVTSHIEVSEYTFTDTNRGYILYYTFGVSDKAQAAYMAFDGIEIAEKKEKIKLDVYGDGSGNKVKIRLRQASGEAVSYELVQHLDFIGWQTFEVSLEENLLYPLQVERIYVLDEASEYSYSNRVFFDKLRVANSIATKELKFDKEEWISDKLHVKVAPEGAEVIRVFGATAGKNRLLDYVIMNKVYEELNKANLSIFAGSGKVEENQVTKPYQIWKNKFYEEAVSGIKFIHLGTNSGGIRKTNPEQYEKLQETLANTTENNIIIIANESPIHSFDDTREGDYVHKMLVSYQEKTGKNIFFVHAGGYDVEVSLIDGIRYFDINGLWYQVSGRYLDIYDTFYVLDFYVKDGEISYRIHPLYPLVEIQ